MTKFMKRTGLAVAALALLAVAEGLVRADTIVYATADGGEGSSFGTLDVTTGQYIQTSTFGSLVTSLTAGNGTLYAGFDLGNASLYTVNTSTGSRTAFSTVGAGNGGYSGLAYAGTNGFYAISQENYPNNTFSQISSDGLSCGSLSSFTVDQSNTSLGGLAYGPDGNLYFNSVTTMGVDQLYMVDSSGNVTAVGTGLGTSNNDGLTLFTVGSVLYGIDSFATFGSDLIYTINTSNGIASSTGVTVYSNSNLGPNQSNFTLDTAASLTDSFIPAAVPEPSSLVLCGIAGLAGLAIAITRVRRGCVAA